MAIKRRKTTTKKRTVRRAPARRTTARRAPARRTKARKPARKTTKRRAPASRRVVAETKKKIGVISHFFDGIHVAVIKLSAAIKEGDKISIEGATTNFKQKAASMQIEHKPVKQAKRGQSIGLKVKDKVRERDIVYKL